MLAVADALPTDDDLQESADWRELVELLCKENTDGMLCAHDRIAATRIMASQDEAAGSKAVVTVGGLAPDRNDALLERLSRYSEPNIKVVRIEKTSEPLGATVKNEDEAVVVGRIIRGGAAEASGLLHEGDEILDAYIFAGDDRMVRDVWSAGRHVVRDGKHV